MNAPLNAALSTDLPSKLLKLIRRLSSEHDGEVVATARAIERTLKGAGHDLHKLGDFVEQYGGILFRTIPVFVPSTRTCTPPPKPEPKPKTKPAPRWKKIGAVARERWLGMLSIDQTPLTCGGLPHAGYVLKFKNYLERLKLGGEPLNEDEIALIDRWIKALWEKIHCHQ